MAPCGGIGRERPWSWRNAFHADDDGGASGAGTTTLTVRTGRRVRGETRRRRLRETSDVFAVDQLASDEDGITRGGEGRLAAAAVDRSARVVRACGPNVERYPMRTSRFRIAADRRTTRVPSCAAHAATGRGWRVPSRRTKRPPASRHLGRSPVGRTGRLRHMATLKALPHRANHGSQKYACQAIACWSASSAASITPASTSAPATVSTPP